MADPAKVELPESVERAIQADLPPAFWNRIELLRRAVAAALQAAEKAGYERGLHEGAENPYV